MNREIELYLTALVDRAREVLGPDLVGVYLAGSLAFDAYEHGRSDIDIAVVCATELDDHRKHAIVDALRHESLPCPARGLELVVYRAEAAAAGGPAPGFEVELNTGPRMDFRATYAGADRRERDGRFWYGIDRSILAQRGRAVHGPPVAEVFGPVGEADLLDLLVASLRWHLAAVPDGVARDDEAQDWTDDAVLNASRALVRVRTGRWCSKRAAADLLLVDDASHTGTGGVGPDPAILERALAARDGGAAPSVGQARRFQRSVLGELLSRAGN
jgi:hypothetical protein